MGVLKFLLKLKSDDTKTCEMGGNKGKPHNWDRWVYDGYIYQNRTCKCCGFTERKELS